MAMPYRDKNFITIIIELLIQYGLVICLFAFSVFAKIFSIIRNNVKMTRMQIVLETAFSGFGSALTIYILYQMNLPLWIFCISSGFSSLIITPVTTIISKEATPIMDLMAESIKKFIRSYTKKNT